MKSSKFLTHALLGAALAAAVSASAIAEGSFPGSGAQPVSRGATGRASLTQNNLLFGNGTNPIGFIAPGTAGRCLVDNGTLWTQGFCVTASGAPVSSGGTSVLNPGTGTLEAVLPIQTVTGASKTFATADLFKKTRRSNAGSAMTDTLPAAGSTGLVNGTRINIVNSDASASDTVTAGAGTTIGSSSSFVIGAGRDIMWVYDLASTSWRADANTGTALLGPNNLSDIASAAAARTNLGLGTIATQNTPLTVPGGGTGQVTFTSNLPLIGNGTAALAQGSVTGNTTKFATSTGTLTANDCIKVDASGNLVDNGATCGAGANVAHTQNFVAGTDFTAGTTTTLTLSSTPTNAQQLLVAFDGVVQSHNTWGLSGAVITFNVAIPANVSVVETQWQSSSTTAGVGSLTDQSSNVASGAVSVASPLTTASNTLGCSTCVTGTGSSASGNVPVLSNTGTLTQIADSGVNLSQIPGLIPTSSVVTITSASPGVVTWPAHGLSANAVVYITTTGTLLTGLTATDLTVASPTRYYVVRSSITTNTFALATLAANANAGIAINTSGSQSGTHTAVANGWGCDGCVGEVIYHAVSIAAGVPFSSGTGGIVWNTITLSPGIWGLSGQSGVIHNGTDTPIFTHMHSGIGPGYTSIPSSPDAGDVTAAHITSNNPNGWIFPNSTRTWTVTSSQVFNSVLTADFTGAASNLALAYGTIRAIREH